MSSSPTEARDVPETSAVAPSSRRSSQERGASLGDVVSATGKWIASHPWSALLFLTLTGTIAYFFGFIPIWGPGGKESAFVWAWRAWNPETNYEHAKLIPVIFAFLVWHHRGKLAKAPAGSSNWGLLFIGGGVILYLLAARTLQARLALLGLPLLIFGVILYVLGPRIARILLFPVAFLWFMVPLNFIEQATFRLQFVVTGTAQLVCGLLGISITAVGTTLKAADGSWGFEIAEGCSGIRSLMAMMMLAAIYVHLTQDKLWKKVLIFSAGALFAVIGNAGRIVTIVLMGKFIDPELAGGIYHDYSAFIFFPIALGAMLLFSKLVNYDYRKLTRRQTPGNSE